MSFRGPQAPNIQRGGEFITAVIPQPGNRPIRVYVRTVKERNTVTINGECSCASWASKKMTTNDGTLEEKIHTIQQCKKALADGRYQNGGNHEPQWSQQDLDALFGPLEDA